MGSPAQRPGLVRTPLQRCLTSRNFVDSPTGHVRCPDPRDVRRDERRLPATPSRGHHRTPSGFDARQWGEVLNTPEAAAEWVNVHAVDKRTYWNGAGLAHQAYLDEVTGRPDIASDAA